MLDEEFYHCQICILLATVGPDFALCAAVLVTFTSIYSGDSGLKFVTLTSCDYINEAILRCIFTPTG